MVGLLLIIVTLGIGHLIWALIVWGGGRTPALAVVRMRCWRPQSGRVAGWWWMVTRRRQALHDLIAGTVVLYDPDGVLWRG